MDYVITLLTSKGLLDTVLIGLLGGFILKSGAYLYQSMVNYIYLNSHFSISGVWVSSFTSYIPDKRNIELIHLKQNKESVVLCLEQYSNIKGKIKKYRGKGVFRGGELSLIYYPTNKDDIQNGVFVLKVIHSPDKKPELVGIYTEFSYAADDTANIEKGDYRLIRLNIPFLNRLLSYVRGSYFKDYSKLNKYIETYNSRE